MEKENPKSKVTAYHIEEELDHIDMIAHSCPMRDTNGSRK